MSEFTDLRGFSRETRCIAGLGRTRQTLWTIHFRITQSAVITSYSIHYTKLYEWEFDETFVSYLRKQRILAIDMELATLFSVAYHYEVPIGSIMLVSDMPLQKRGIKDKKLEEETFSEHMESHLDTAIDSYNFV